MEQFEYDDWKFEFDKEATELFYKENKDTCGCSMCRNFRYNIYMMPKEVKNFLEQFGIDIRNPIEQHLTDNVIVENQIEQEVVYVVNGIAKSDTGYEIDIGTVQIVIDEEYIFEPNINQQCFFLTVYNMYFPWTVEEDIEECFPKDISIWRRIKQFFKK